MQPRRSLNEMSGRSGMRLRRCRPAVRFTGVSGADSVTSSGDSDLDFLNRKIYMKYMMSRVEDPR
jgi:hypothetical protein